MNFIYDNKDIVFKKAFNCTSDALLITYNDLIVYSNKYALKLLEMQTFNSLLNKNIWNFISPKYVDTLMSQKQKLHKHTKPIVLKDMQILTSIKNTKNVKLSLDCIKSNDKYYTFYSLNDLSNIKKLKKDISKEKTKVDFFANISHDLKTPINVIYGATQLQDMYTRSKEYDKLEMYNNIIRQNCLRLQKSLNDLLDISKIDSNYFKPKPIFCNIISIIENITESVSSYFEHKDITIVFDTNVEEKITKTDPDLIERILLNLISNGIKYGKQDGKVWVALYDEGENLIISVKDNGIGIPEDQLNTVFNRFSMAGNNSDNSVSGNGIGLSLVKSIVGLLDGEISCLSTINKGSEFIVILPMKSYPETCNYELITDDFEMDSKLIMELSDI